jgi:acetoacetyl-CoA synthetase
MLKQAIRQTIRAGATARHVPAVILDVPALPRTLSGKVVELAVRNIIHGQPVQNQSALANPEALEDFANRPELL